LIQSRKEHLSSEEIFGKYPNLNFSQDFDLEKYLSDFEKLRTTEMNMLRSFTPEPSISEKVNSILLEYFIKQNLKTILSEDFEKLILRQKVELIRRYFEIVFESNCIP
jgi:hypothetical protein